MDGGKFRIPTNGFITHITVNGQQKEIEPVAVMAGDDITELVFESAEELEDAQQSAQRTGLTAAQLREFNKKYISEIMERAKPPRH